MVTNAGHDPYGKAGVPAPLPSLAERILTIPVRHEDILRPVELLDAVRQDLAEELNADVQVLWLDATLDLPAKRAKLATAAPPQTASFELRKRGVLVAHLVIDRVGPLAEEENRLVGFLARDLSHWLTEASKRIETRLITALSTALPTCDSLQEVARVAVFTIVERLGAEAGMLLMRDESGFRPLAALGTWNEDAASERERREAAEACAHAFGPEVHAGNVVAAPVGNIVPVRYVFLLRLPASDLGQAPGFPTLMQATRVLEPHLNARWHSLVLAELLTLGYASLGAPTDAMYASALRAAVRLVPGADGGSLLVRQESQEPFVVQAVYGNAPVAVLGRSLTHERLLRWYGSDHVGWQNGNAKVLQHGDSGADIARLAHGPGGDAGLGGNQDPELGSDTTGRRVQASLVLPVVFDGTVLALLCLENGNDHNAFGRDSREIAEMFGAPLASMLQRQRTHELLVRAAITDSLTGLSNRRAFDAVLTRELARTARSGVGVSVLLMDMGNFKAINDSFGHEAGDAALVAVAGALRASVRDGDHLFRWGGDEFAAILVDEAGHLTLSAVERVQCAVSELEICGQGLRIDVGWAEAPVDGLDAETLLRVADERMYTNKRSD